MMHSTAPVTAADFEELLREGERWLDLAGGRLARLEPPDEIHGNVVYNLSKAVAGWVRQHPETLACFDVGIWLHRNPDTVHCPAISCFQTPGRFGEVEKLVTDTLPSLVVEVGSTADRREGLSDRLADYRAAGVPAIWVIDTVTRHVHQYLPEGLPRMLKPQDTLTGEPILPGFAISVAQLFADPPWMKR